MLCSGAKVKIRVHWRISIEAPESMQESKLFARRLQELDERFVNTFIRKNEIFYMPFTCSPIWRIIRKLFLSTGCLCYNSSSDTIFLDGRFPLDADRGNWSLLLRCESLQHKHQNVHVSRHLMGLGHYFTTCTGNCNHAFGSPNMVLSCSEVFRFPSFLCGKALQWSWWPFYLASLLEKKEGVQSYTSVK